jgi:Leucine-rich repeat (LRR) protein
MYDYGLTNDVEHFIFSFSFSFVEGLFVMSSFPLFSRHFSEIATSVRINSREHWLAGWSIWRNWPSCMCGTSFFVTITIWFNCNCYSHLSNNNFSGTIRPQLFTALSALQELLFDSNRLNGTIPTEIGYLTQLQTLDFSNNSFSGSLPTEIGKLSGLITL